MLFYSVLTLKCTVGLVFIVNGAIQVFMYVCMYGERSTSKGSTSN